MLQWLLASLHLLALGIGLGAVVARAFGLRSPGLGSQLSRVFLADGLWGGAAFLWISTGVWRAFGGVEKGTAYYLHSNAFWVKMSLLGLILALEVWPMITLVRWRRQHARGQAIDLAVARGLSNISLVQCALVVAMVFAATAMARGLAY